VSTQVGLACQPVLAYGDTLLMLYCAGALCGSVAVVAVTVIWLYEFGVTEAIVAGSGVGALRSIVVTHCSFEKPVVPPVPVARTLTQSCVLSTIEPPLKVIAPLYGPVDHEPEFMKTS